jgi:nicotinate-nucleotide adenylyltransferase
VRLALFGGTFDPIHSAHLAVARAAAEHFALDRVLLIPNAIPPHKQRQTGAAYEHRLAMVRAAASVDARLEASDLERGNETSYSILTIERVRASWPSAELYFLIGADAFGEIETWRRWREVIAQVEFIVLSRPGYGYDVPAGAKVHRLDSMRMDVSSTAIRKALAEGEMPESLPEPVQDYIRQHGLYAPLR